MMMQEFPFLKGQIENDLRIYRFLFENASDLIFLHELTTEEEAKPFLMVNRAAVDLLGYSREEILKLSLFDLITDEAKENISSERSTLIEDGALRFEKNLLTKNGDAIPVEFCAHLTEYEGRRLVVSIGRDIRPQKHSEEIAEQSETKYRELADSLPQVVFEADIDGRLTYANRNAYRMFKYTKEDFKEGLKALQMIAPEDRQRAADAIGEVLAGSPSAGAEYTALRKDGSTFPVIISSSPIQRNGESVGLRGVIVDISERKLAETERERLISAIEQAAEMIVITDTEGKIQYVNPAFEEVTGYTREEAVGNSCRILKSGKHDRFFYQDLWATLRRGETWESRIVNRKKDGTLFTEEAVISPVRDSTGETVNYVAVKRDITRELDLEQQLHQSQKMEAIGQLAGGIAHDFNNLLQVIIGQTDFVLERIPSDNEIYSELEQVTKAGKKASDLVRQLLAFSRRQILRPERLSLNVVITDVLKMLRRIIGEDIRLDFLPERDLDHVFADRGMIEQILMNLCVNSRDAMPEGGKLTIETCNSEVGNEFCSTRAWARPGKYVLLRVSDDGSGMSQQTVEHIFEPFFTTKGVGKGSGLGLAMVYGIVKQHGGMIDCFSQTGRGTTFSLYLPAVEHSEEREEKKAEPGVSGGTETILLAEDDDLVRRLAQILLEQAGYTVLAAEDGDKALELFENNSDRIDLLLLDVVMPTLGGRKIYEKACLIRPGIPALFASGYSEDAIHENYVLDKGLTFIQKPFTREALLNAVRQALISNEGLPVER